MSRRTTALAVTALVGFVVLVMVFSPWAPDGASESANPGPTGAGDLPPMRAGVPATLLVSVVPQWQPGPTGTLMTDEWGEHPQLLEAPADLYVVDGPRRIAAVPWFRVYVLPNTRWWPNDYFAWVPGIVGGTTTMKVKGVESCPPPDVREIALLTSPSRARCFGHEPLTLEGHTGFGGSFVAYQVVPEWLGTPEGSTPWVSLYDAGGGLARPPDDRVAWLDVRIPPAVPTPPWDFALRVTGHFDDPAAATCHRWVDRSLVRGAPPRSGLPDELAEDSTLWCRSQFVVSSWEVVAGPEGRPLRVGEVQLHRTRFEGGACAGVGMPLLTFRVDQGEVDPIWLEAEGSDARILPVFGLGFSPAFVPELVVIGPDGMVAARAGLAFNPDEGLAGYGVCPMGEQVTITAR